MFPFENYDSECQKARENFKTLCTSTFLAKEIRLFKVMFWTIALKSVKKYDFRPCHKTFDSDHAENTHTDSGARRANYSEVD